MTGILSGSGKSRTLTLIPEKSDGAINEPGKIKLMPKALGTYTLKAEGYIEYANNLPFALKSKILSKEINITVNSGSNRVERPASGGSSSGGNSGGSNGSFGGVTGSQAPDSSENQENKYKFIDTDSVSWAENAIEYLLAKDIISKPEDKYFRPNDNITREEFVKMIVMALGIYDSSAVSEFDDVEKNAWYYPYVSSAKKAGIVYGNTENQFGVSKNITREDMAVIIVRALEKTGFENILAEGEVFADDKEISLYAKDAVYFAKQFEIINGVGENMFAPKQSATRAQAAKMIYEMMKAVGK